MKKTGVFALLVIAVVAGGWWWFGQDKATEPQYRTVAVDRGDIHAEVSANGTLNPVVLVNVGTQVSGTVQRIYADFNQQVNAGQVLATLDPALFEAALAQSRASLANAQAQLNLAEADAARMQTLFGQEYVSRQEFDQALAARAQAAAQVRLARAQVTRDQTNLGFSVIRSPVDGTVINRQVDVGQTVAASFQTPTAVPDRQGSDADADRFHGVGSRHRDGQGGAAGQVPGRRLPRRRIQRQGAAGSADRQDRAERRHL
jgi:HlyD family secretion protein